MAGGRRDVRHERGARCGSHRPVRRPGRRRRAPVATTRPPRPTGRGPSLRGRLNVRPITRTSSSWVRRNRAIGRSSVLAPDTGVPDLGGASRVWACRLARDPPFAGRADEVARQVDRGETAALLGRQAVRCRTRTTVSASAVIDRAVQVAVGREQIGPDLQPCRNPARLEARERPSRSARRGFPRRARLPRRSSWHPPPGLRPGVITSV